MKNLINNLPVNLDKELMEDLLKTDHFRVERIISFGHKTEENHWYDEDLNEFVLLLSGQAKILFDDNSISHMLPGDWLIINSHRKHRVIFTEPDKHTVWLAIHF